ncbi:MAG: arginyltransferase [Sandaracinus sp.]|nr:arginyltransferase [Myxococcales bacterium]MAT27346.1 arginyltransferase [Sandaracinus sp.]
MPRYFPPTRAHARQLRHDARLVNRLESLPILVDVQPAELLVHDATEACPYLEGRTARMPLRLPVRALTRSELDDRLARGDRRHGALFYRPTCPECQACQAIRLPADFPLSKSQRRVFNRGERELRVEIGSPTVSDERVALYDAHRFGRGLARPEATPMDPLSYQRFLVDRQCDAFELRYFDRDDRLVAVAVTDRGERAMSAVYCYYDPSLPKLSLGTYSILKQLELCQRWDLDWLYLGLYIEGCDAMSYKARFQPHERLVDGTWTRFE